MSISVKINHDNVGPMGISSVDKKGNAPGKSIDGSALNRQSDIKSRVEERRELAKKQAMKLISNAWGHEEKAISNIKDLGDKKNTALGDLADLKQKLKGIDEGKENLRQEYGVDKDSQEQKDLELLEKYQDNKNGSSYDKFSDEEIERLKKLQSTPLTEYQKRALELNGAKDVFSIEMDKKNKEIIGLTESISDAESALEKSQEMLKANDAADEIMDVANKEILGMLIEEGKNNIDEEAEENKEKAEKAEEKREEQQERIDKAKEEREEQEEIIEASIEAEKMDQSISVQKMSDQQIAEVQKNIQQILKVNNLVNEDIKGIEIDLNF